MKEKSAQIMTVQMCSNTFGFKIEKGVVLQYEKCLNFFLQIIHTSVQMFWGPLYA